MRLDAHEAGLEKILAQLGITVDAFLGQGGEAFVFALDGQRIARIMRGGGSRTAVERRRLLLDELGQSADKVTFAIPKVLDTLDVEGTIVTVEERLAGRPLQQVLSEKRGQSRAALVRAYLDAAAQIGDLTLQRPWFGDLTEPGLHTRTFREYLVKRAQQSLQKAGPEFEKVEAALLASALPEPEQASFVHLDAFPGNMLAQGNRVTAVLDFGASAIMGDRRFDPLTAAIYLAPAMTPEAHQQDRAVARAWLVEKGLLELFIPVQNWIAAYWSFARDDPPLYQWCQRILLGEG